MTMPRKMHGWRRITVNGVLYRWQFGAASKDPEIPDEGNVSLRVIDGRVYSGFLAVTSVRCSFDRMWLDYVYHGRITPSLVARYIGLALDQGWRPDHPNRWFVVKTETGVGDAAPLL